MHFIEKIFARLKVVMLEAPELWSNFKHFAAQVRQRLAQERATQTASSLTFTTILALVPLVTVVLAVFTAFPAFYKVRIALEDYFIESLMPVQVASIVTGYLMQFASKAKSLSMFGAAFLLFTVLMMFLTIEKTMNALWQVPPRLGGWRLGSRLLLRRLLAYWAVISIAPFAFGVSIYATAQLIASTRGLGGGVTEFGKFVLQALPFVMATSVWALIFKTMPNTQVLWKHALIGASISSLLLELLKQAFVVYLAKYANFKEMYGAFSVVPVLLIWLYLGWWVTLLGGAIASLLPSWGTRYTSRSSPIQGLMNHLRVLRSLHTAQNASASAGALQVDTIAKQCYLPVEFVQTSLLVLEDMGWVAKIQSDNSETHQAWVLLNALTTLKIAPLLDITVWKDPLLKKESVWSERWALLGQSSVQEAMTLVASGERDA